ncbi:hypothetical protein [Kineococcus sp. SYSU DK005]|uniref:hypothetical protein n=1 Tax=Kineococcus sp. SYSU DK005 TaxID=3383126 RepID=UPI003D7DB6DE
MRTENLEGPAVFATGGTTRSWQDLEALPTDSDELAALIRREVAGHEAGEANRLRESVAGLLRESPASPALHAEAGLVPRRPRPRPADGSAAGDPRHRRGRRGAVPLHRARAGTRHHRAEGAATTASTAAAAAPTPTPEATSAPSGCTRAAEVSCTR